MLSSLRSARRVHGGVARLRPPRATVTTRSYASVTALSSLPQPGDRLHGFTLERTKHVPELELSALHFRHDKTGADYLHVAREDKNNVFSIGFKTNPPDATGVPHILEHVTLCGSEKYPVRDPFFKMLPRSLQNFMNAFTSSDYTMYPFATTNVQDFKNLMGVYLDATLHPLLKRSDFVQEGWRIGPENPKSSSDAQGAEDLVFKGVVYNEMKGQMSDATYLFYIRFMEHIIPALNNSGGDPQRMTDLTYDQLKSFHGEHYHPSNSKILTYGDQSVKDHLRTIGEQLDRFEKMDVDRDIKLPITLSGGAKEITVSGPVDPLIPVNAQFKTSITWLMGDATDIVESFALQIAASLLLDGYGSPMYRALVESGLGTDFTPNTGYDTSGRKGVFSIGLNGVSEDHLPEVRTAITSTLLGTIDKGFDRQKVDGLLHQLELGLKHKTANFGMGLIQKLKPGWFNGIDPFDALSWNSVVNQFKAEYSKDDYLEGLMRKYVTTDDTLTFTMAPSESYGTDIATEEAGRLKKKIVDVVSRFPSEEEAHEHLRKRELELLEEQSAGELESLDALPTLHVSDIPRVGPKMEVRDSTIDANTKIQWREAATNGLTYFRALASFENLPDELRMLVPLFTDSLMRIGTKTKSMEQLEDLMKLKTGGISFAYHTTNSPFDTTKAKEGFLLGGHAFDHNVPAMYELIHTILVETDFDSPKARGMIKQLLQSGASGAVDGIASSGHSYARLYAEAGLTSARRIAELKGGLTQIKLITSLASAEDDADAMQELVNKLKSIQAFISTNMQKEVRVALTCSADTTSSNESALQAFLQTTRSHPLHSSTMSPSPNPDTQTFPPQTSTFFPFPYQVSYTAIALPTVPYTSPASAPLSLLGHLLTNKHLHHELREKGGAYGAGAYARALDGVFGMYTYRDPNPANALAVMRRAGAWAAARAWSPRELEEAKLSAFQAVDAPLGVAAEGIQRFLTGVGADLEQERRERLLDVDAAQVREAAERVAGWLERGASVALLGPRKALAEEEVRRGWVVKDMGMGAASADAQSGVTGDAELAAVESAH